jgi:hypothetical protein
MTPFYFRLQGIIIIAFSGNGKLMAMYSAIIAAIGVALVVTILFVVLGMRGPWGSAWTLFLFLFMAMWVTGLYVSPVGPVYWGIAWVPIIFAGILFSILLIAVMPDASRNKRRLRNGKLENENRDANISDPDSAEINSTAIGSFFWILIMLFTLAIIVGLGV